MQKIIFVRFRITSLHQRIRLNFPQKCVYCAKPAEKTLTKDITHKHILRQYTQSGLEKIQEYIFLNLPLEIPYCPEHYALAAKFNKKLNLLVILDILINMIIILAYITLLMLIAGASQSQEWFAWVLGISTIVIFSLGMWFIKNPLAKLFFKGINPKDIKIYRHMTGAFNTLGFFVTTFKTNQLACTFDNLAIAEEFKSLNQ